VAGATTAPATGHLVTPTGRLIQHHDTPREQWLDARRAGIGSSDLPAVLNLSGFKTPQWVYYDKRGEIPHDESWSEAAHFGTIFEEPIARDWARRKRTVVNRVGLIANTDEPWQLCTLDRLCTECPFDRTTRSLCAVEVKCRNAFVSKFWRNGPPDDVLAQVLWQILVTGLDHIHVMCVIGGNDPRLFTVRRADHTKLVAYINAEASKLWHEHILAGRVPAITGEEPPDALIELYQRLHPEREGYVVLDRDLDAQDDVAEYLDAVAEKAAAEKKRKAAKAKILARLGGAQAAVLRDLPYFSIEQSSKRTPDLDRLAEEFPEAYAACVVDKPHDRLSIPAFVRKEHAA
jgi:putative phage-type endonuclease